MGVQGTSCKDGNVQYLDLSQGHKAVYKEFVFFFGYFFILLFVKKRREEIGVKITKKIPYLQFRAETFT